MSILDRLDASRKAHAAKVEAKAATYLSPNGKCKHGLDPRMCACCAGPVRVAPPIWDKLKCNGTIVKAKRLNSVASEWTIATVEGPIVICGVCKAVAVNFTEPGRHQEYVVRLVSYIRTNRCKDCGDTYIKDEVCPQTLNEHRRKWLVRAMKVAACRECAGQSEYEVDADDLTRMPDGRTIRQAGILDIWRMDLKERGLLA